MPLKYSLSDTYWPIPAPPLKLKWLAYYSRIFLNANSPKHEVDLIWLTHGHQQYSSDGGYNGWKWSPSSTSANWPNLDPWSPVQSPGTPSQRSTLGVAWPGDVRGSGSWYHHVTSTPGAAWPLPHVHAGVVEALLSSFSACRSSSPWKKVVISIFRSLSLKKIGESVVC